MVLPTALLECQASKILTLAALERLAKVYQRLPVGSGRYVGRARYNVALSLLKVVRGMLYLNSNR